MKVVAIIGSRTDDYERVYRKVVNIFRHIDRDFDVIVSGGAKSGADYAAKRICRKHNYRYAECQAFWDSNMRKGAGHHRNVTIAMLCTHMVAVWDGKSNGTRQAIEAAQELGKPVWVIEL